MSASHLKDILHSSNVIMRPLTRLFAVGTVGSLIYVVVSDKKPVERIQPNYLEWRKQKGLPETELKHPFFGAIKELRIIPEEERKKMRN